MYDGEGSGLGDYSTTRPKREMTDINIIKDTTTATTIEFVKEEASPGWYKFRISLAAFAPKRSFAL